MPAPMQAYQFTTTQAKMCRRLAKQADDDTSKALLGLADEYEAKAIELDETTRNPESGHGSKSLKLRLTVSLLLGSPWERHAMETRLILPTG